MGDCSVLTRNFYSVDAQVQLDLLRTAGHIELEEKVAGTITWRMNPGEPESRPGPVLCPLLHGVTLFMVLGLFSYTVEM